MIPFIPNPAEKVVVLTVITTTFRGWLPRKNVPPRNTPDHFAAVLPRQNPSSVLRRRYFSFLRKNEPWQPHEPSERDIGFPVNAAAQTGVGTSFGTTGDSIYEQWPFTYFCVLTIQKQLSETCFERSGRGQEPSRGHKFSIRENVVLHRDFTSATLASFDVILLG